MANLRTHGVYCPLNKRVFISLRKRVTQSLEKYEGWQIQLTSPTNASFVTRDSRCPQHTVISTITPTTHNSVQRSWSKFPEVWLVKLAAKRQESVQDDF